MAALPFVLAAEQAAAEALKRYLLGNRAAREVTCLVDGDAAWHVRRELPTRRRIALTPNAIARSFWPRFQVSNDRAAQRRLRNAVAWAKNGDREMERIRLDDVAISARR